MCKQFEGIGVTVQDLREGAVVMVAFGRLVALANGQPCVIAPATVIGPASEVDQKVFIDGAQRWWLAVHVAHGVALPQMYRRDEILGVPALSLFGSWRKADAKFADEVSSASPLPGTQIDAIAGLMRAQLLREAQASTRLDGETHSLDQEPGDNDGAA